MAEASEPHAHHSCGQGALALLKINKAAARKYCPVPESCLHWEKLQLDRGGRGTSKFSGEPKDSGKNLRKLLEILLLLNGN